MSYYDVKVIHEKMAHGHDSHSSVFLSPPLSHEESIPNKSKKRTNGEDEFIPFTLDENSWEEEGKLDILTECLKHKMISVVLAKILDELSDFQLLRASQVSQTWRQIIKIEHMKSGRRLSRYLSKAKKRFLREKENFVGKLKYETSVVNVTPIHTPSPLVQHNVQVTPSTPNDIVQKTPTCVVRPSSSTYRQCPCCQSPARTSFKQYGHCTSCNNDFCIHCFYTNNKHSPTCQLVGGCGVSGSMTRKLDKNSKSKRYSIGSSNNKARLKRL